MQPSQPEEAHALRAKKSLKQCDIRVSLFLALLSSLLIPFTTHELSFVAMMVCAFVWLCLKGKVRQALFFSLLYVALYVFSTLTIGVATLSTLWMMSNVARHILAPISFISGVMDLPTGSLFVVFDSLRLPKAAGIATSVLLRFFPTIGREYQAIRTSLKFRGIGVTIFGTILHLYSYFERILVPLLIRTARISEELSAAAIVRGVRLDNKTVSFDETTFTKRDALYIALFSTVFILIVVADNVLGALIS